MLFTTESVDFYSLKAYGPTSVCGHLATMCNSCHSNLAFILSLGFYVSSRSVLTVRFANMSHETFLKWNGSHKVEEYIRTVGPSL